VKVLITGGAGFIGSHAAEFFSRDNAVTLYDNLSRGQMLGVQDKNRRYNIDYLTAKGPKMDFYEGDLRDFQSLKIAARATDFVVHAAGQVAIKTSVKDPRTDFEINALGTFNVLEAARINDAAVVFCSTNKVYGENVNLIGVVNQGKRYVFSDPQYANGIPESFSTDNTGHSPYGSSKLAADTYVQDYARTYGLRTGVFRMSCIYGERQFGAEDQGWLAWFTISTVTRRRIVIYGDGKQVRDTLYVTDLIDAFDRFLRSDIKHAVFNMGGGPENTLSLLELLDLLQVMTGVRPEVSFEEWRLADQRVYISDIRKAQEILHWKPKVRPQEGIKRVISWVRENRPLFNQFASDSIMPPGDFRETVSGDATSRS